MLFVTCAFDDWLFIKFDFDIQHSSLWLISHFLCQSLVQVFSAVSEGSLLLIFVLLRDWLVANIGEYLIRSVVIIDAVNFVFVVMYGNMWRVLCSAWSRNFAGG